MWGQNRAKKACRSVLSQWYHSGDATSNRERNGEGGGEGERRREKGRDWEKRE